MTTVDYILIIIAVVIMVVGIYMIIRAILARKNDTNSQAVERDKNGIPIIPRHERKLVEEPKPVSLGEIETIIIPNREHLKPVIHDAPTATSQNNFATTNTQQPVTLDDYANDHLNDQAINYEQDLAHQPATQMISSQQPIPTSHNSSNTVNKPGILNNPNADTQNSQQVEIPSLHMDESEDDVFSTLATATEKLMPVIDTAQETEFADNSPMLDHHLLAEADQDQNSPLNHAQENINITVVPKNSQELIDGKTILSLVSQYGLKYGAMNMFHRYENKDGSGILWFSMMGINQEGIAPFDLNLLPTSHYYGLVLFLSLPHPKATQGFDTMMSVVNLIANDLNAQILDENNEILTRERRQQLRAEVQEYQASMR
ncbi:cell division protein ZipA C-terminal FtsZ-binding domain-containing protein [Psychrobacter sp.]|uniref:cell division protein ZipA C-terminal FtsZ-binding domain-containing protein n=1 Tax=Psychrobacter sp. TaxID=56811 RepID=UPI0025EA4224|nr:cell division protein ZipA C-terminal FtsZ-binding domain-containing protein [Psychrobacter sp.]